VLDPASGHPKVTGDVQLDIEKWTVFDGMVVGKANDKLSPGRDTIVAYRLDTLALAWQAPQPAGSSIEVVRPCGPHAVCAGVEANGGGKTVTGFGTADGKQRWQLSFDGAVDEKWYVLGGQLVMGDGPFDNLNEAVVVNNGDGKVAQRLDPGTTRQYTVVAGDGNRMALSSVLLTGAGSTVHWQVQVQDLGSGSRSAGVDIGDKLPKYVSLVGGTLMVITESRQLRILRVPGAPGASPALK